MALGETIRKYPMLRLAIPFACGIWLADALYALAVTILLPSSVALVLVLLVAMLSFSGGRSLSSRIFSGIITVLFFLVLGSSVYSLSRAKESYVWSSRPLLYEACLLDYPRERARSLLCVAEVTAVCDSAGWSPVRRKVFAYMQPSAAAGSLQPGDMFCFRSSISPPRNFSQDLPFDYARYLRLQGVSGTLYLPSSSWKRINVDSPLTVRERLVRLRHRLQTDYMRPVFEDDVYGVISALTLGDKRPLSDEVREVYADAGVSHVLALSGLHVGVIYGLLSFLLRGVVRRRSLRWLRESLTVIVLWLFALMVGMSASVVRAVTMCTLYMVARWVSRDSSSFNTLSLAAFVMLLVKPYNLFDVSFQLSYMAMVAILWLEPYLERLFGLGGLHPVVAYPVGIVCMSLAAQLGTFPLVLYHFGTFPVYFLLTNLIVIPALYVVLLLTLVWWVLVFTIPSWAVLFARLAELITHWVNGMLSHIAHWPCAVLHTDRFGAWSVLCTYLLILFLGLAIVRKWSRGFVLSLAALLALLLSFLLT